MSISKIKVYLKMYQPAKLGRYNFFKSRIQRKMELYIVPEKSHYLQKVHLRSFYLKFPIDIALKKQD